MAAWPYGFYGPGIVLFALKMPGSWRVKTVHIAACVVALSAAADLAQMAMFFLYPNV